MGRRGHREWHRCALCMCTDTRLFWRKATEGLLPTSQPVAHRDTTMSDASDTESSSCPVRSVPSDFSPPKSHLFVAKKPIGILRLHKDRRRAAALRLRTAAVAARTAGGREVRDHGRGLSRDHLHASRGVPRLSRWAPYVRDRLQ